ALLRLNLREATLRAVPAWGEGADVEYAAAVLEYAVQHVGHSGKLLDVGDPRPERLIDPIADQLPSLPSRETSALRGQFSLGALPGELRHVGAAATYKPDRYQAKIELDTNSRGEALP